MTIFQGHVGIFDLLGHCWSVLRPRPWADQVLQETALCLLLSSSMSVLPPVLSSSPPQEIPKPLWNWQDLALRFWLEQLCFSSGSSHCFVELCRKNKTKQNQSSFQDVCKAFRRNKGLPQRIKGDHMAFSQKSHCRILLKSCGYVHPWPGAPS